MSRQACQPKIFTHVLPMRVGICSHVGVAIGFPKPSQLHRSRQRHERLSFDLETQIHDPGVFEWRRCCCTGVVEVDVHGGWWAFIGDMDKLPWVEEEKDRRSSTRGCGYRFANG